MKPFSLCILFALCLSLCACQSPQTSTPTSAPTQSDVSADIALERASRVMNVNYQLDLDITNERQFNAKTQIQFELTDTHQALRLDFNQGNIGNVVINGHKLYPDYDGKRLLIPASLLSSGTNTVSLHFSKPYNRGEQGLIQYRDPVDNRRYLYSHFLPSSAQMMMPQFDQPDLKANYSLRVTAPSDWLVYSAAPVQSKQALNQTQTWQFAVSQPTSPHNFSLIAGPYRQWRDDTAKVALFLLAPQSMQADIDPLAWLTQTRNSLNDYQQRLATAYPFTQYTQVVVPHLPSNYRANLAVTTFNKRSINTSVPTLQLRRALAEQWLGNLVTLKWWDNLWLNPSLAYLVADSTAPKKHSPRIIAEDYRRSAHSVEQRIRNSLGIVKQSEFSTQNKAIAQLSQLQFLLGEQTFYQGIQDYLQRYTFKNASLSDFIASLEAVAKRPLSQWSHDAFIQSGVNTIEAEFLCHDGRVSQFTLSQHHDSQDASSSPQKVRLGLFTQGRQALHKNLITDISFQGQHTKVKRLRGVRCPDLVFPNYQNKAYVRVKLDPISTQTALLHLSKIKQVDLRIMLWQSLWESVLAGELPLNRFIGSSLINLPLEPSVEVLTHVHRQLRQAKALLDQMSPNHRRYSERAIKAIAQMSLRMAISLQADTARQSLWFDNYLHFGVSHQAKRHLARLLEGSETLKGVPLTPARRWAMIVHLNRYDHTGAQRLAQREKLADNSKQGQQEALNAEVSRPLARQKRQWFERIQSHNMDGDSLMLDKLTQIMRHLYPSEQKVLSQATAEQRLTELATLDSVNSQAFMRTYTQYLLPMSCSHSGVERLQALMSQPQTYSSTTLKGIANAIDAEKECLRVQQALER